MSSRKSSTSSRSSERLSGSSRSYSPSEDQLIKVYILQAKLDPTSVAELYALVENRKAASDGLRLQLCGNPSDADVILSNVHMRKRLERHLDWNIARQKAIVTPDWLRNSIAQQRPLPCADYAAIGVLRMHRDLEGKTVNALSYERAIAVIKAYPRLITLESFDAEIVYLPHLGDKLRSKVKEYIRSGHIVECDTIRSTARFQSLKAFSTIHGVGSTTARHLYSIGLRTIEDMERYYDVPVADDGTPVLPDEQPIYTPNGKRVPTRMPDLDIRVALVLRHEFAVSIPRGEVEEMHNLVMAEFEEMQPGCASTIVGGYRRGKSESNDVDIVITHPDLRGGGEKLKSLRKRLVVRLYERGMLCRISRTSVLPLDDLLAGLVTHVARK
ncbi:hypothetical protein C0992_006424 [Termitomyces sp. T32_za158]|nr:hypothetical protein C0992_006424 [Termitomyces sp. T32_za158]